MNTRGIGLAVVCVLLAVGCTPFGGEAGEAEEEEVAVLRLALDGSTQVRSVHIRGARRSPADPKYPCTTQLDACVDFAAPIRGLCPSVNLAPGTSDPSPSAWDFEFAVFEGESCTGTAITGGTGAALVCYGASDLGVPGTENKVVGELLAPGPNSTQVICIAKPATQ